MIATTAHDQTHRSSSCRYVLPALLACWFTAAAFVVPAAAQNAQWGIFVMKPDGSQVRMLAQVDGCTKHRSPRWSHDGRRVAFAATTGSLRAAAVYVVNVDGSGLRKLAEHTRPDWSPDDKQIALQSYSPGGQRSIFVQNLDGQGRTQICDGEGPRWSPDGSRLAVVNQGNVQVVDLVTGETTTLLDKTQDYIFHGFSWFPDGKRLVMSVRPGPSKLRHLLIVNADGSGLTERWKGGMGGYNSFSPDGKKLVFENFYTIHTLEVDGTGSPQQLPGQKGANVDPDWSPDGEWIVFASSRDPI